MTSAEEAVVEHRRRSLHVQQLLRWLLAAFLAAALLAEPPTGHRLLCWVLVAAYGLWVSTAISQRTGIKVWQHSLLPLAVDVTVLVTLALLTDASASTSWTPYLLATGFFILPFLAAAQLSPTLGAVVGAAVVISYLGSSLLVRSDGEEPWSYIVLRAYALGVAALGAVLLARVQRSRVADISGLLQERTILLKELVDIERREQRELAETLHDGALQYILAARMDLEDLHSVDMQTVSRIEHALTETADALRLSMSQLHPAVVEQAGLRSALSDLVGATQLRGRFEIEMVCNDWDPNRRSNVDGVLLTTARELLTNVVKHARASAVVITLTAAPDSAVLTVSDNGRGMGEVDLSVRLREGHLGLASHRARIQAAGGEWSARSNAAGGTTVQVAVPAKFCRHSSML